MSFQNVIGSTWLGWSRIKHLIIFGDSYSAVGYIAGRSLRPREDEPLGVAFPGDTYAEEGLPNWVGHLVTNYANHGPLLVYDYAVGGHTVVGVRTQVRDMFLPRMGQQPLSWSASETLFITWVGINDCAWADETTMELTIKQLFEEQEMLYQSGARNFLLFDIPPINRTPTGHRISRSWPTDKNTSYATWNVLLPAQLARFVKAHPDITAMLFSSWNTFSRVLDDPVSHGLKADDLYKMGGSIWVDHLHPTSAMHDWIAHDLANFLAAQKPYEEQQS